MKRIFATLFLVALSTFVFAQSYSIFNGPEVSNTTLTYWVDSASGSTFTTAYWIHNNAATPVRGKVRKRIYQLNTPTALCWWCVGVNCYPPTFTISDTFTLAAGAGTMLTCDFDPDSATGTTIVRYTVFNYTNAADSTYIDIVYNMPSGPAAVSVHSASGVNVNVFPNPATEDLMLNYDFPDAASAVIVDLYDMNGNEVGRWENGNKTGSFPVSVADLPGGMYVCAFWSGAKLLATKDVEVVH
ncbi:MAG TPA: T9SS type A sorting domain-containing protein [Bacteroidia bacterium]|jgi:hypothetical protein|nr:T9SS type A sorting domain-containing protein [Bacteroidia bacterium]